MSFPPGDLLDHLAVLISMNQTSPPGSAETVKAEALLADRLARRLPEALEKAANLLAEVTPLSEEHVLVVLRATINEALAYE